MSLYEYRCKTCGLTFNTIRAVDKRYEPSQCSFCGKTNHNQLLISLSHFQFAEGMPSYMEDGYSSDYYDEDDDIFIA